MIKYFFLLIFSVIPLCGMMSPSLYDLIEALPIEIRCNISRLIMEDADFSMIDSYEKCTSEEMINRCDDYDLVRYHQDEAPIITYGTGLIGWYESHVYQEKNLKLVLEHGEIVKMYELTAAAKLFKKSRYLPPIGSLFQSSVFSPHNNLFAMRSFGSLVLRNTVTGKKVVGVVNLGMSDNSQVFFGVDEPIIKTFNPCGTCHKLYFDNPVKQIISTTMWMWQEAHLLRAIFMSYQKRERFVLSKKSDFYTIYKNMPKEVRRFLSNYLAIKIV